MCLVELGLIIHTLEVSLDIHKLDILESVGDSETDVMQLCAMFRAIFM